MVDLPVRKRRRTSSQDVDEMVVPSNAGCNKPPPPPRWSPRINNPRCNILRSSSASKSGLPSIRRFARIRSRELSKSLIIGDQVGQDSKADMISVKSSTNKDDGKSYASPVAPEEEPMAVHTSTVPSPYAQTPVNGLPEDTLIFVGTSIRFESLPRMSFSEKKQLMFNLEEELSRVQSQMDRHPSNSNSKSSVEPPTYEHHLTSEKLKAKIARYRHIAATKQRYKTIIISTLKEIPGIEGIIASEDRIQLQIERVASSMYLDKIAEEAIARIKFEGPLHLPNYQDLMRSLT